MNRSEIDSSTFNHFAMVTMLYSDMSIPTCLGYTLRSDIDEQEEEERHTAPLLIKCAFDLFAHEDHNCELPFVLISWQDSLHLSHSYMTLYR